jgi:hypothetical protein
MNMKHKVDKILQENPDLIRELVILIGVIQLCKIMDVSSFQNLINQYNIKSNHWWPMINEITEDEDFLEVIEGEFYEEVLKLQMWLGDHNHGIIEGSVLWNLIKNGVIKTNSKLK